MAHAHYMHYDLSLSSPPWQLCSRELAVQTFHMVSRHPFDNIYKQHSEKSGAKMVPKRSHFGKRLFCGQENGPSEEPFWLLFFEIEIYPTHQKWAYESWAICLTRAATTDLVQP